MKRGRELMAARCTTSALSALKYFSKLDPAYRANDISCVA